jgi:hypothetical protein
LNYPFIPFFVLGEKSSAAQFSKPDSQRRGVTAQQASDANGYAVGKVTVTYSAGWLAANQVYVQNSLGYGHGARLTISNRAQRHYLIAVSNGSEVCSTCNFQTNTNFGLSDFGHAVFSQDAGGGIANYSFSSVQGSSRPPRKSYWRSYCLFL